MPNPKLILVDLDGTLFDTVAVNAASYRAALEEVGSTVTDEYYAAYCNGGYYKTFLRPLLGGDPAPELVEQVHDRKKRSTRTAWAPPAKTRRCLRCCTPCGAPPIWRW